MLRYVHVMKVVCFMELTKPLLGRPWGFVREKNVDANPNTVLSSPLLCCCPTAHHHNMPPETNV